MERWEDTGVGGQRKRRIGDKKEKRKRWKKRRRKEEGKMRKKILIRVELYWIGMNPVVKETLLKLENFLGSGSEGFWFGFGFS